MKISLEDLTVSAKGVPASIDHELLPFIAKRCSLPLSDIVGYTIEKRSLDARKKPDVKLLYRLCVQLKDSAHPKNAEILPDADVEKWSPERYSKKAARMRNPIIVGAGPAGLFAALVLAEAGAAPVLLERGFDVVRRKQDIDTFFQTRILNPESNLLFGEGGAGTWSDGKLFTRIRDPRMAYVMEGFVGAGAPPEILYFSHPHIGSDLLPGIIASIRRRIMELGGTVLWGREVVSILKKGNVCTGVILKNGEHLESPSVMIAPGHSSRKLLRELANLGTAHRMKGFQIGVRIEHPQAFINRTQYGVEVPYPALGAAEYQMASRPQRAAVGGATTFCMCPGGEILPATSDLEQLSTNGMSNSARNGRFANSAVISSLSPDDFSTPEAAFQFLDDLEHRTFCTGGSDYSCPAQNAVDFVQNKRSVKLPEMSFKLGATPADLNSLFPSKIAQAIKRALQHFDVVAPGFLRNGVLYGLETRVSSPVRFERDPDTLESSFSNLYLAGEGAGMAGGITSAAVDGVRLAEAMLQKKR